MEQRLPRLGYGFTTHPAFIIVGEHARPITNFVGLPKSYYVDQFAESDHFVLETCMYFPFITAKSMAGFGAPHSAFMRAFPRLQMILVLACDEADAYNRVAIDKAGRPVVHYRFQHEAIRGLIRGAVAAAKILFAAGAVRVHMPVARDTTIEAADAARLDGNRRRRRIHARAKRPYPPRIRRAAAAWAAARSDSVTDSYGRVHGLPWLFVADASLFPNSLEINPYVTIMALADRVAQRIREEVPALRMKMTGADIVVRALEDEGIPFTFGIPGTHNIELYDSLARSAKVRPILVTDEQSASFMADGVARSSGMLAAANVVPGAGLTHALSGIAEAYLDGIPMLVLACGIRRDTGKAYQLHAVDQQAIARPVTKAQFLIENGADLYATIRRACRIARAAPAGPVFVEVPAEHYIFRHDVDLDAWRDEPDAAASRSARPISTRRVRLLAACRRPLLYLGLGAAGAGADLVALAERLEAPVATTFEGKGIFPESHPLWLWCGFGAAAPPFVQKIAAGCDLTLAIGCRFSEVGTGSYGLEMPGKLIHVDIDPSVLDKNYRADLPVVADAAAFIAALLSNLPARQADPQLREAIRAGHAKVWSGLGSSGGRRKSHAAPVTQGRAGVSRARRRFIRPTAAMALFWRSSVCGSTSRAPSWRPSITLAWATPCRPRWEPRWRVPAGP